MRGDPYRGEPPFADLLETYEWRLRLAKMNAMERIMKRKEARVSSVELQKFIKQWEENVRSSATLGATYRDKITGFRGVCTGYCEYLSGCNQVLLIPRVGKDGKAPDGAWYDVQRLDRVAVKVIALENERTPGCDMPAPMR